MTGPWQRRFVRRMRLVVLIGAILPNVTFFGHWHVPGLGGLADVRASAESHKTHCHGDPDCSEQPSLAGAWWASEDATPVSLDSERRAIDPRHEAKPDDGHAYFQTPPPRLA